MQGLEKIEENLETCQLYIMNFLQENYVGHNRQAKKLCLVYINIISNINNAEEEQTPANCHSVSWDQIGSAFREKT